MLRGMRGDHRGDRGGDRDGDLRGVKQAPSGSSLRHNRFWALAGLDGDESDDEDGGAEPEIASPTPSDLVCESLHRGYTEAEVAGFIVGIVPPNDKAWDGLSHADGVEVLCRVVHRRTASVAIRPWKGPLPKVIYRATSWIRTCSLLNHAGSRELMAIGCNRWETVARAIFSRFGWQANNRLGV